ncbi:hypothetical protein Hanom_Chr06g00485391 [Helianthus anomalus]
MGDARMRGWVWCTPRTSCCCWYNATNRSTSSPPTTHCNLLASTHLRFSFLLSIEIHLRLSSFGFLTPFITT